jgi:hypothetical protein
MPVECPQDKAAPMNWLFCLEEKRGYKHPIYIKNK